VHLTTCLPPKYGQHLSAFSLTVDCLLSPRLHIFWFFFHSLPLSRFQNTTLHWGSLVHRTNFLSIFPFSLEKVGSDLKDERFLFYSPFVKDCPLTLLPPQSTLFSSAAFPPLRSDFYRCQQVRSFLLRCNHYFFFHFIATIIFPVLLVFFFPAYGPPFTIVTECSSDASFL